MKLIDKKDIETEAKNIFSYEYGEDIEKTDARRSGFEEGVYFAEEKILPLMVGFADWLKEQNILICETTIGNKWKSGLTNSGYYTSDELLEQFLKTKTDKNGN